VGQTSRADENIAIAIARSAREAIIDRVVNIPFIFPLCLVFGLKGFVPFLLALKSSSLLGGTVPIMTSRNLRIGVDVGG
jgi:hypothetical protein